MKNKRVLLVLSAVLGLIGCEKIPTEPDIVEVSSVAISETAVEIMVGESLQLSATVEPMNATDKEVSWSSSDDTVLSVSPYGLVSALKEGKAVVTALAGKCVSVCQVSVVKGEVAVSSIDLDKTVANLKVGETITIKATVRPDDATDKKVEWKSSDETVAKVDNDGKVTAVLEGSVLISATAGNITAVCSVTVNSDGFKPNGEYLAFTGLSYSGSITYECNDNNIIVEYSLDTQQWFPWNNTVKILLNTGTKIYVRGGNWNEQTDFTFKMGGEVAASGNIMSLLYYDDFAYRGSFDKNYKLYNLFRGCDNLVEAPDLPATVLYNNCYRNLFRDCTNLTKAPDLPATTLASGCYSGMFYGCSSLTTAPELPATTLEEYCYEEMFEFCTALEEAPDLPATELADYCYRRMFTDCISLSFAPSISAINLAHNCCAYMFLGCKNLKIAPRLQAMILAEWCYEGMFAGCSKLTRAPELPATIMKKGCYEAMFDGCTNLTDAPELPATTLADFCYSGIFYQCTNLTTAPDLPTTKLAYGCYEAMFAGCSSLTCAPELPATELAGSCYHAMFLGCSSLTQLPSKLPATNLATGCYSAMFARCKSITTAPVLPATELAGSCYAEMFSGCTKLNYIKMLAIDIPNESYIQGFLNDAAESGTFVKHRSATWDEKGIIPDGWTVTTATE